MKAITTKYIPATNTRGAKVRATDDDNSVTLAWSGCDRDEDNHQMAARALCEKLDWHGTLQRGSLSRGGRMAGDVFVFINSRDQIEV
jgi:hypothetical protein